MERRHFFKQIFGLGAAAVAATVMNVPAFGRTLNDDLHRQMAKLQFIMGGQVSSLGLRSIGLDYRKEMARMLEEQKFEAEYQAKLQNADNYTI